MSLCRTISIIATEAEGQMFDLLESQKQMLQVLKDAPQYLAAGNLAQWDAEYHRAISVEEDESSRNFKVIDSIFELGAVNLYGAYQADETKRVYALVVEELQRLGIHVSSGHPVETW